jgi:hypothetical protein
MTKQRRIVMIIRDVSVTKTQKEKANPMENPNDTYSSSSIDAADQSSPRRHAARWRTRLIFWLVSSCTIVALGALNLARWIQEARKEARRQELQALWATVFRALEQAPSMDIVALNPAGAQNETKTFHSYGVLGRATIRDAGEIKALASAYRKGRLEGARVPVLRS